MAIRVSSVINVAENERFIRDIRTRGPDSDILLPTNIKAYQFGGVPALIQAIITWSKGNPHGRLVTYISHPEDIEKQLRNLVTHDHGLAAVMQAADVVMQDRKTSIQIQARQFARTRIEAMETGVQAAARGPKVLLLCVDHSSKAFLPEFYFQTTGPDKDVKGAEDFRDLVRELLLRTAEFNQSAKPIPLQTVDQLGIILRELFDNTHQWARTECNGMRVKRSIRGLLFQLHNMKAVDFQKSAADSPPFVAYLSHSHYLRPSGRHWFLEMSVFDSGPGLAQRIRQGCLSELDPISAEYDAVIECLKLRSSTSLQSHRGIGLPLVLSMLTQLRGFLRIRTGRLSLYRDFAKHPYENITLHPEPFLLDWNRTAHEIREWPRTEGTLLTMFVPIESQ